MLNTRDSVKEGRNERTYTMTKHITLLLLRSRVKNIPSIVMQQEETSVFQQLRSCPFNYFAVTVQNLFVECSTNGGTLWHEFFMVISTAVKMNSDHFLDF